MRLLKETFEFRTDTEADALNGKISNESPVGAALIGSKVGETIVVETISGDLEFKILEIARA